MKKANQSFRYKRRVVWELLDYKWFWFGFVVLGLNMIYSQGMARVPTGLGDSDLFLWMSQKMGLMNSPGYPLYLQLLYLVSKFPAGAMSVAVKGHWFSAWMGSLAGGVVILICWSIFDQVIKEKRPKFYLVNQSVERLILALAVAFGFGFSGIVWRNNVMVERYSLSTLLVLVWLWLGLELIKNNQKKWWYGAAIVLGLGLSHQWVFWCLVPVMGFLAWEKRQQLGWPGIIFGVILIVGMAVLPWLSLFSLNSNQAAYGFVMKADLDGLRNYIGENYLGDGMAKADSLSALLTKIKVRDVLGDGVKILKILASSMGGLSLIWAGAAWFYIRPKKQRLDVFTIVVMTAAMVGLGIAVVIDWQVGDATIGKGVFQTGVVHGLVAVVGWFGLWELIHRLGAAGAELTQKKYYVEVVLTVVMFSPVIYNGWYQAKVTGLRERAVGYEMTRSLLTEVEPDAVIACFSNESCYSLLYTQQVEGVRSDVTIVPYYYKPGSIRFDGEEWQRFDYQEYPMVMFDVLTNTVNSHPTYTVDMFDDYFELLGVDYGFVNVIPMGYYFRLQHGIPESLPQIEDGVSKRLAKTATAWWDEQVQSLKIRLARNHLDNGRVYIKTNMRQKTFSESNLASALIYSMFEVQAEGFQNIRKNIESIQPSSHYDLESEPVSADYVLEEAEKILERGRVQQAIKIVRGAVVLEPENVKARLRWADLLAQTYASEAAVIEYGNVLKLDPDNKYAQDMLEYQKNL